MPPRKVEANVSSPAMEFVVDALKKDKSVAFADLRDSAKKRGLTLYPIAYGRAKALLGLVPMAKQVEGKAARARAPANGALKRNLARPRKDAGASIVKRGPGRPKDPHSKSARIHALLATGAAAADIAKRVGCSVNLVYVVKTKARHGPGHPPRSSYATTFAPKRGPGRPRKVVSPVDSLDSLVSAMRQVTHSATNCRRALEQVFQIVSTALRA